MMKRLMTATILAILVNGLPACVSAARGNSQDDETYDEALGLTPWQKLELGPREVVSMYALIANSEKYDNRYIQIKGFLRYEVEGNTITDYRLYPDKDSLEYGTYENAVSLGELLPDCAGQLLPSLNGEFVILSGVYRPRWRKLTPIDHIRWIKRNPKTREFEEDEVLCNDPNLIYLQKPEEE
jgi:hypothetical protein